MTRSVFFPLAHGGQFPDSVTALLEDSYVYLAPIAEDEFERAAEAVPKSARTAGFTLAGGSPFAAAAYAAAACADEMGGIDALSFAPALSSKEPLFLDISPDDFAAHAAALQFFFGACKCALPYLIGREAPVIAAAFRLIPGSLPERRCWAALDSIVGDMAEEFGGWGVEVRKIYS